jgi:hypothetical protein
MRHIIARLLVGLVTLTSSPTLLFAADTPVIGKIHHFSIIAPPTAKIGEAIDVTVEAKDKDNNVITTYRGSIFFQSDTDFGATLPAQGKAIQFKESDNGSLKISKGLIFKRVGKQELTVTETMEDVSGSVNITVEDNATTVPIESTEPISIMTPAAGSTITTDTVEMSGKTKKNSKVLIKLNGQDAGSAQTDDAGIFTYKLTGINQQTNIVTASVVNGTNTVIGTTEITFNFSGKNPVYYNTSIQPGLEVEVGTGITIQVDAEPTLSEVTIAIDGTSLAAREWSPWKYSVTTVAPAAIGSYSLSVTLKNILAQTTTKTDAATLVVKEKAPPPPVETPKPMFKNVTVSMTGARVNVNFGFENPPANTAKFRIMYGESANNLSEEVTTSDLEKIRQTDGTYNWYISKLSPKTYTFRISPAQADGTIIAWVSSEPVSLTVGKEWACSIGNITNLTATVMKDKSVLSWDALTGATSYNVYKISASGDHELLKNVKENAYTLFLKPGTVTYEDFAVKGLCDEATESHTPAVASRVQTGPWALAVLVVFAALASVLLMRRKMI